MIGWDFGNCLQRIDAMQWADSGRVLFCDSIRNTGFIILKLNKIYLDAEATGNYINIGTYMYVRLYFYFS